MLHAVASGIGLNKVFDLTLPADTASIDTGSGGFSIAGDQLLVSLVARTTEAVVGSTVTLTFNNDTGANYDAQRLTGANTTASAGVSVASSSISFSVPGASAQAGAAGAAWLIIPSYAQTTFHKSGLILSELAEDTAADLRVDLRGIRWRSTSAISRVIVTAGSGNLLTGSRLSIYLM